MQSIDRFIREELDIERRVAEAYPGAEYAGSSLVWPGGDLRIAAWVSGDEYAAVFINGASLRHAQRGGDMAKFLDVLRTECDELVKLVAKGPQGVV